MSWAYHVNPASKKFLSSIPKNDASSILDAIEETSVNPYSGDIQKLGGRAWRKRAGSYRIKFEISTETRTFYVYEIERRTSTTYRKR
ncbi:MAG TPA: hypothetical protein VJJ22_03005 [Candidatus Paceibacterota bacterium]